ncbi:hypothetical protein EAH80_27895 [Mycobacterium hodleri]|uniref:Uncharacterized protein n=1 Tax=Mycolicibacterium hodleri TaxID=49897 RepID=A0A502DSV2_9MYCO|nr:hypothetical protein EAH80_27895 [Mycolicibacterium hodleri]
MSFAHDKQSAVSMLLCAHTRQMTGTTAHVLRWQETDAALAAALMDHYPQDCEIKHPWCVVSGS